MAGLPALTLWDTVIDVLQPPGSRARRDPSRQLMPKSRRTSRESIDYVPPNAQESSNLALLFIFEDDEALIKMTMKGQHIVMCQEGIASTWVGLLRESMGIRTFM